LRANGEAPLLYTVCRPLTKALGSPGSATKSGVTYIYAWSSIVVSPLTGMARWLEIASRMLSWPTGIGTLLGVALCALGLGLWCWTIGGLLDIGWLCKYGHRSAVAAGVAAAALVLLTPAAYLFAPQQENVGFEEHSSASTLTVVLRA
jgi:hypothetical protein